MQSRKPSRPTAADQERAELGQASVYLLLVLGTILLTVMALAVDMTNMWFRRQQTQTAADAACQAGALDMLATANGTTPPAMNFTANAGSSGGDCTQFASSTICKYAKFNGYDGTGGFKSNSASSSVSWTFPTSLPGVTAPSSGTVAPYLQVSVAENVKTWFLTMVGVPYVKVSAACLCGLAQGTSAAPLIILNKTVGSSLWLSGGAHIVIAGGPTTSVEVNSSANGRPSMNDSGNAVFCDGGNGFPIDTSLAGPAGTGGQLAIVGGPTTNQYCGAQTILNDSKTTLWKSGVTPAPDPYASTPVPAKPATKVTEALTPVATPAQGYTPYVDGTYGYINGTWVASGVDSCPNTATNQHYLTYSPTYPLNGGNIYGNCLEFTPGYYPNGIDVAALAGYGNDVAIFMPGVYYLKGDLHVGSSSTIRNAWVGTQPSTVGVTFFFLSGGPRLDGGSGSPSAAINSVPSYYMNCLSTSPPGGMPASFTGNLLISQCSRGGTYVGDPSTDSYSSSGIRGLLFFLDHANSFQGTVIGAGASLSFSGALYFHNASYLDKVELDGAGASSTYAIGNIVVDQLKLSGSGTIKMSLNTTASSSSTMRVAVFQ